jgi:SAM-dependent methyltransferase
MEYNGLVLLDYMRQSELCRYDYALCHGCGLVYATRRPDGDELQFLADHFDEFLGRDRRKAAPLSADERADIERRLQRGWLVSEEHEPGETEWLPEVLNKRIRSSYHVNLIAALTDVKGARVLELRSTTGFMLDMLRKHFGAAYVCAMPMSERHDVIIRTLNDMPTALVDFDTLEIPFEGQFDLILARHMFTHMLYPERLWALFRERLRPGGRVYLFLENDDATMFARRKNLLGEMKCFHFQNFDLHGLARALRWNQLEPEFIRHPFGDKSSELVCMARYDPGVRGSAIGAGELESRLAMYEKWRTWSVAASPDAVKSLYAGEMTSMVRRAVDGGYGRVDEAGRFIPHVKLKIMHDEGYRALNEGTASH